MDQQGTSLDQRKNQLEKDITNALFDAVKNGQLLTEELQSTARKLWDEFEMLKTDESLSRFTSSLGQRYPYLSQITLANQDPAAKQKEKEVIDKLSQYIKTAN